MRIAWLAPYPTFYLARRLRLKERVISQPSTWIVNLSKALREFDDVELHIITLSGELSSHQKLIEDGIMYHFLRRPKYIFSLVSTFRFNIRRLHEVLEDIQPDIVHGHGTEDVYSYAAVTSKFPFIISIQGIITEIARSRKTRLDKRGAILFLTQFMEKYTVRRGRYFIVKTPFDETFVKSLSPDATVFRIWEPINEEFFKVKRNHVESATLVFVGFPNPEKGIEELLMAVSILRSNFPLLKLNIIGPNDIAYVRKVLKPQAVALGVDSAVEFLDFQPPEEVAKMLSGATMLVLPSYMENSPNVVSEAMAAGVPVVASNVGGIPFMVKDGETGFLVGAGDVDALAERIMVLLKDRDLRLKMGKRAKEVAKKRFNSEVIARKTTEAYEQILRQI